MGITSIEEFMKFSDTTYKIGLNLIQFKSDNKGYIDDLISVIDVQDKDKNKASSKGLICMTGSGPKGRKELTKDIENMNYEITNSLNGETSILLCEDPNGSSSKLQKARKLGIKIMSYEDFLK